jgi:hypothetical protein
MLTVNLTELLIGLKDLAELSDDEGREMGESALLDLQFYLADAKNTVSAILTEVFGRPE